MNRYPDKALSSKKAVQALALLLAGCTDERLRTFTASGLATSYNVPTARVEGMLADARRRRSR